MRAGADNGDLHLIVTATALPTAIGSFDAQLGALQCWCSRSFGSELPEPKVQLPVAIGSMLVYSSNLEWRGISNQEGHSGEKRSETGFRQDRAFFRPVFW